MTKQPFYKNIHFILLLTAVVTDLLLYYVFMYVNGNRLIPYGITFSEFWRENWLFLLQFYVVTYFVYYSLAYFNRAYSRTPNAAPRFIKEILFITLVGFLLQEVFRTLFIKLVVVPEDPATLNVKLRMLQMVNVAAILVQYSFMTSLRIYRYLQQKQLEVIKLQKEYTQSQFELLKNQLNPHFLFNSLSILSSLVYVDSDMAETFIERLSRTYRYLLEQRDKEKVEVTKELDFLQAYAYLLDKRFGKKLVLAIDAEKGKDYLVPHSLLIAMEYIISNNTMSAAQPLRIKVSTEKDCLEISYSANPKANVDARTMEQLHYLQERYQAMVDKASILPEVKDGAGTLQFHFVH